MNKDKKGLLAYIIITIVVILMAPTLLFVFVIAGTSPNETVIKLFDILLLSITILFLLYFIAPVVVTHRAITKKLEQLSGQIF